MQPERTILEDGLRAMSLSMTTRQTDVLLSFVALLVKWNKAYNLTAVRQPVDMVRLHVLDSLAVAPHVYGGRVADVGTGAGLPGIPLAIALPACRFVLLDANAKKTRFVRQAVLELKLDNVEVLHARVENYQPDTLFNTVIMRAFANLSDIIELTRHLLADDAVLLAMKGQYPKEELASLALQHTLIPVTVPGVDAERCLVRIPGSACRG